MARLFGREPDEQDTARPVSFLGSMREAVRGGAFYGKKRPARRAERLGLTQLAAAIELGYQLPWLAVSLRKLNAPSQPLYPGRRGHDLGLPDRRLNRDYVLHFDGGPVRQIFDLGMLSWLADALAVRIQIRPIVTIEVSNGWALTAVQARGLARPDEVELRLQGRNGHPGPWPDVLLRLLRGFRDHVPPSCRY